LYRCRMPSLMMYSPPLWGLEFRLIRTEIETGPMEGH